MRIQEREMPVYTDPYGDEMREFCTYQQTKFTKIDDTTDTTEYSGRLPGDLVKNHLADIDPSINTYIRYDGETKKMVGILSDLLKK